jgi:hypothetical protein
MKLVIPIIVLAFTATARAEEAVPFRSDVVAALSRAGCNGGACHGSPQGKNGFRLSLRGFDADLDFNTLVKDQGGRRINRQAPDESLVLQKGSGRMPHGGGMVFKADDAAYRTIARWIAEGCADSQPVQVKRLEIQADGDATSATRKITAKAHFADGTSKDVTPLAVFTSSDSAAMPVTPGLARFTGTAEATVLVRYLNQVVGLRLGHVVRDPDYSFKGPKPANAVDEHVFNQLKALQLLPAKPANDEVFLRRVYLDVIGIPPTAEEARAFLDSKAADKRAKLIDSLLERDEYASFWALKWADVLRGSPASISDRGVHSFHRYLVRTVATDRPMTEFARELLTATGNTLHKPAANFYRVARTPEEAAEAAAQLFLGVRVQCAKCHNHPFEAITQTDYYGLAAFFARVQYKGTQFGLDDEIVTLGNNREVNHPKTRKPQEPISFGTLAGPLGPDDDRRERFADWLTAPGNKYFANSIANRTWYHLLGKGIIDPVDDVRDTNPPSNPKLLEALASEFARGGYKLKPLIRLILNSQTYQLGSERPEQSRFAANPERYFTRATVRMLAPEQILDAVSSATGVAEVFKGYPAGTRAIELAEGGIAHPFLQAFAKPVRDATCECAREDDPSLPGVLHLLNNAGLVEKVKSPKGLIPAWLKANKGNDWVVEQIYLGTLSRKPTAKENELIAKYLKDAPTLVEGLADLQHALINTNEFLLRH